MRILGFSQKWDKLEKPAFTTFRLSRRDRDWQVGEVVQVVYKPRAKKREVLGIAKVIKKEPRRARRASEGEYPVISNEEAKRDGFKDACDMWEWLLRTHGLRRLLLEPINKLTLGWTQRWLYMNKQRENEVT